MIRRTDLVKEFRALLEGKSRKTSWADLMDRTLADMGMITPNDSHSILVALSKALKPRQQLHPVKAAPVALGLINRVLDSPEVAFRTKAGVFGLVNRLGIDWTRHLPEKSRDRAIDDLKHKFVESCESSMDSFVDPQAIGYACEAAVEFSLVSPEFTQIVAENLRNHIWSYPPLAVVQVARYLDLANESAPSTWEALIERTMSDLSSLTPQNLACLLRSTGHRISSLHDWEKICEYLSYHSGKMRLQDCLSFFECLSIGSPEVLRTDSAQRLVNSLQRRARVLIITSPVRVSFDDVLRICCSLEKLVHLGSRGTIHSSINHFKLLGVS